MASRGPHNRGTRGDATQGPAKLLAVRAVQGQRVGGPRRLRVSSQATGRETRDRALKHNFRGTTKMVIEWTVPVFDLKHSCSTWISPRLVLAMISPGACEGSVGTAGVSFLHEPPQQTFSKVNVSDCRYMSIRERLRQRKIHSSANCSAVIFVSAWVFEGPTTLYAKY